MTDSHILNVAICQFQVTGSTRENAEAIRGQMREAAKAGADIAHFPEVALTGYPGYKGYEMKGFDWDVIREETLSVMRTAREEGIWVLLPSAHRLTGSRLPHNCVYVIDDRGDIRDRYDKRFCARGDLAYYSPGWRQTVFTIKSVTCGIIICYEKWFPELFRAYKRAGVDLIFDSIHSQERDHTLATDKPCLDDSERALWIAHARLNHIWISVSNHCRPEQDNTSFLVDPDGRLFKLPYKRTCVSVHQIDPKKEYWDPSGPFRDVALSGAVNNGTVFEDPRSEDRRTL